MNEQNGDTTFFLAISKKEGLTLASERLTDGRRAVLVFSEFTEIEAFRIIEGLGSEWQIVEHDFYEAALLLESCAEKGIRFVALNPPTSLTRGHQPSEPILIHNFIDHLLRE